MTDLENLIIIKNIVHYNKLLQEETDPDKSSILLRLLEKEIRKRLATEATPDDQGIQLSMT